MEVFDFSCYSVNNKEINFLSFILVPSNLQDEF